MFDGRVAWRQHMIKIIQVFFIYSKFYESATLVAESFVDVIVLSQINLPIHLPPLFGAHVFGCQCPIYIRLSHPFLVTPPSVLLEWRVSPRHERWCTGRPLLNNFMLKALPVLCDTFHISSLLNPLYTVKLLWKRPNRYLLVSHCLLPLLRKHFFKNF